MRTNTKTLSAGQLVEVGALQHHVKTTSACQENVSNQTTPTPFQNCFPPPASTGRGIRLPASYLHSEPEPSWTPTDENTTQWKQMLRMLYVRLTIPPNDRKGEKERDRLNRPHFFQSSKSFTQTIILHDVRQWIISWSARNCYLGSHV